MMDLWLAFAANLGESILLTAFALTALILPFRENFFSGIAVAFLAFCLMFCTAALIKRLSFLMRNKMECRADTVSVLYTEDPSGMISALQKYQEQYSTDADEFRIASLRSLQKKQI